MTGLALCSGVAWAQADTTPPALAPVTDTTVRDTTAVLLPVARAALPNGPYPAGTRYTFSLDSLVYSNIITLSDLLAHIPGVFVARGGFVGQAEPVLYGGRGAQGLEVYWDGVPYLPLGRDSVFLDPARISLAMLERVDVIVLPAALRVYLITARHSSTEPRTEVRIATGDMGLANYHASFARRWRSGAGINLAADFPHLDGEGGTTSSTTEFSATDIWGRLEFIPTPRAGISAQVLSSRWARAGRGSVVDEVDAKRIDAALHFFAAARADGLGSRVELALARARVGRDTAVDSVASTRAATLARAELTHRWARGSAGVGVRFDGTDQLRFEAQGAWMPAGGIVLAADLRHVMYGAPHRSGDRLHLQAGVPLVLGFSVRGDIAVGRDLQAPAVVTDSAQETTDFAGALRWQSRFATLQVGGGRRGAFVPIGFASGISPVARLGPTPRTDYVRVEASVRPLPGLELSGWYADPVRGGGDFEPPYHARYSATFYSKFWRVYRSGVFALRGEVAIESWSVGLGGRDTSGVQLPLPGATFVETNIEMRVVGITLYYKMRNANAMRGRFVEGLGYPTVVQFYGARWVFRN